MKFWVYEPGADRGVLNEAYPSSGLKFLAWSKVTQFLLHGLKLISTEALLSGRWHQCKTYGHVQLPWQLLLIWLSSWMGPCESSAAFIFLLIVYEHNFYCLVRTILVPTKDGWIYEKGIISPTPMPMDMNIMTYARQAAVFEDVMKICYVGATKLLMPLHVQIIWYWGWCACQGEGYQKILILKGKLYWDYKGGLKSL